LENSFHKPIPIHDAQITLKTTGPVKRISSLTDRVKLTWTEQPMGQKQIMLPKLDVFEIVLVEYEP
jgi:hypothetical protein